MSRKPNVRASGEVHAVRIPEELAKAIYDAAGGKDKFAGWFRDVARAAVGGATLGGSNTAPGYREGWQAGWAQANETFREALADALKRRPRP